MKKTVEMDMLLQELEEYHNALVLIKQRLDKAIKCSDFDAIRRESRNLGEMLK